MSQSFLDSRFGQIPDLIQHLRSVFRAEKKLTDAVVDPSDEFIVWSRNYLNQYRPTEIFPVDNNQGIRLTNGITVALCPLGNVLAQPSGGMANPDTSVRIL